MLPQDSPRSFKPPGRLVLSGAALPAIASLLLAAACAGDGIHDPTVGGSACFNDPNLAFDPTLTCIQEMVFTPTCAVSGCHRGGTAPQNLHLTARDAYSDIYSMPALWDPNFNRVTPLDPNNSYIVMKLAGDQRILGVRMPFGGPILSSKEIDVIREWILRGALDN